MELFNDKNSKRGMTSPIQGANMVELNDFFNLLDEKTIEKIKETTSESIARISQDVEQMEYEADGAKAILDMLK